MKYTDIRNNPTTFLAITRDDLDSRVVARRMRNAILSYMESDRFAPSITLASETISNFFTKQTPPVEMYTNDTPDELKPKLF